MRFTPEIYQHYLRGTEGLHITDGWRDEHLIYSRNVKTKPQQHDIEMLCLFALFQE